MHPLLWRILLGDESCWTFMLAALLCWVANRIVRRENVFRAGVAAGVVAAIADAALLVHFWQPAGPEQLFGLVLCALVNGLLAADVTWIGLTALCFAHEHTLAPLGSMFERWVEYERRRASARAEAARTVLRKEAQQKADAEADERKKNAPPPSPPEPVPTRAERVKAEMERYAAELAEAQKEPDEALRDVLKAGLDEEHRERLEKIYRS